MAIGDQVLDLRLASELCPWPNAVSQLLEPLAAGDLAAFMGQGRRARRLPRDALSTALAADSRLGPGQGGSMLELSSAGKQPIALPGGEQRSFLDHGDTVILRGACTADGARRNGFGECRTTVLPAV